MKFLRDQDGSILIELAVAVPLFLVVLAGLANYAFWINEKIQLQEAANAGAAYATIPGNQTNIAGMKAAASASPPDFNVVMNVTAVNVYSCMPGGATVASSATCTGGGGPLLFAQVTTTATEYPIVKFTGVPASISLQGFASLEVVP